MNANQLVVEAVQAAKASCLPEEFRDYTVLLYKLEKGSLEVMHTGRSDGLCDFCDQPATWVRKTQFSGTHHMCRRHAEAEDDFGKEDPSYFFWEEIEEPVAPVV